MKIINRIMISSALLVLLSLVALLAGVSIISYLLPSDPGKEILDQDVFLIGEILAGFDASVGDWDGLNVQLQQYGHKLLVLEGDTIVLSTLGEVKDRIINSLKPLKLDKGRWREKYKKERLLL